MDPEILRGAGILAANIGYTLSVPVNNDKQVEFTRDCSLYIYPTKMCIKSAPYLYIKSENRALNMFFFYV